MEIVSQPVYRFADIEIDPDRGLITQNGVEQYLRQQTFQVLLCLIERRSRLVSKQELVDRIWHGAAVTDNAIVQCIADIRRALGDDPKQPRFIKTLPKVGYRFIGRLEELGTETSGGNARDLVSIGEQPSTKVTAGDLGSLSIEPAAFTEPSPKPKISAFRIAIISGVFLMLVALATSIVIIRNRRALAASVDVALPEAPGERSIAVMYFDNQSGDPDLNWLREGLADMIITGLSRSNNLTVLSRQQLHVLLGRIGHNEFEKIRLEEAIDVARRSRAQLFVSGSFERLGNQIRIDAHLHDARDGQLLAAERLIVDDPAQILTQIDLLSLKLGSHLGGQSDQTATTALTSVMTNNLKAYRDYSLGVEKAQAMQNPEAIALLQEATRLDPEFAMAYARTGYAYAVTWGQPEKGRPFLEKAFRLSARLTEKDKLYINGWYAIANYDYDNAIKSFREIVARFPFEVEAHRRLGDLLHGEERFQEAIEILKQGLVIDPGAKDLYNTLGSVYADSGRHEEAIESFQHYVRLAPQEANAHDSLGGAYQWAGRYDEAIQEYNRALELKPDFEIALIHLANACFQQGRYQQAIAEFGQYIEKAPSDVERTRGYDGIAYVELRRGNLESAQRAANSGHKYSPKSFETLFLIAMEKKDLTTAAKLLAEIEKLQSSERGRRRSLRPLWFLRGMFDLRSGRSADAINDFREASTHRPQTWSIDAYEDCLANAYLELQRFDEAIAEYQRILKLNANYPLAHYHLAQAFEKSGQLNQARAEYERSLEVWKDADREITELASARKWIESGN